MTRRPADSSTRSAGIFQKFNLNLFNMRRIIISLTAAALFCIPAMAENLNAATESAPAAEKNEPKKKKEVKYNDKGEIIKTGINLGPCPVVAFDADRGFQYGALLNLYNFGDGSTYPNPKSTWYFEASAYTKGSYKFVVNYDNKAIFPGIRMSICTGYYGDKALDFYGFNGYQSIYDMDLLKPSFSFTDEKLQQKFDEKGKMPKGFYRYSRQQIKAKIDFTGKILENFFWEAGYNFMWNKIGSFKPAKALNASIDLGGRILAALIIFIIGKILVNWANKLFAKMLEKRKVEPSIQSFLKSIVNITLLVLLFLAVIGKLGIELTSFAALLASAGVAVGMALSGNLSNFAGGVIILVFRPYKVGDYIEADLPTPPFPDDTAIICLI